MDEHLSYHSIFTLLENHCRYYLSICAIFQDEASYLKEWIEYHRLLGVDHFYLYNNGSRDDYLSILTPYISQGIVDLTDWPSCEENQSWIPDQTAAYNHCLGRCQGVTHWLGVIDIDEFIVPIDRSDLVTFLSDYDEMSEVGGVRIYWQMYGTSWLPKIPTDKLLTESLILKGPWNYENRVDHVDNTSFKTIVKPVAVCGYRIHRADYREGFYPFPLENPENKSPLQIDRIRINHYWTRAEDFFYNVKIPRRLRIMEKAYEELMHLKMWELNQITDTTICKYAEALRKRVF